LTSGGARRGRRDNGLVAAAYAAAGDVDPRVGEHLLDVLAVRGIAAYLQPAADLHPVTRTTTLPSRPTDRLFVDREHLDTARGFLAQLADEAKQAEPDVDELFAGIVAGYDTEADEVTWPAAEDLDADHEDDDEDTDHDDVPPARLRRWRRTTVDPRRYDPRRYDPDDEPDEDDEGYVPPPPPPLPRISFVAIVAVLAVIAGFIVFFNPDLLPVANPVAMLLGFGAILAGFVGLIWRLRSGYDDDDDWDPDDGAVV
jgi:hypothetical protein